MQALQAIRALGSVAVGVGGNLVTGAISAISDAGKVVDRLAHKDLEGSLEIVGQRVERTIQGACTVVDDMVQLLDDLAENREVFLRQRNIQRMTSIATMGTVVAIGVLFIDDSPSIDANKLDLSDTYSNSPSDAQLAATLGLPTDAVENGVFVGNESDLAILTRSGEIPGTTHVDASDVDRSLAVRNQFLADHGYTSVPDGFEVHHIIPVSEGGSDSTDNMILIDEEQHDQITAAHRDFYGWNRGT